MYIILYIKARSNNAWIVDIASIDKICALSPAIRILTNLPFIVRMNIFPGDMHFIQAISILY